MRRTRGPRWAARQGKGSRYGDFAGPGEGVVVAPAAPAGDPDAAGRGEPDVAGCGEPEADADADPGEPDAFGAGVIDGCGSAYSAKTAGRFATSLSVADVPENSSRAGGRVGDRAGVGPPRPAEVPGSGEPDVPGRGVTKGVAVGAADEPGFADALALAAGTGAAVVTRIGGGVDAVSSSATARRYFESFSPEFQSARPNSPSRYCEAISRGMSSWMRG